MSIVVCDGDSCEISEESQEDDQIGTDSLVDDDHRAGQVDLQVQAKSDTVLDVGLHALENLASNLDSFDNCAETRGKEDNIGSGLSGLGGTLDSDTAIRLLQRWSIIDTVTSHGSQVATLLQHLDDLVLVLGEDFSETIGLLNEIVLSSSSNTTSNESLGVVDLGAESKKLAGFLCDGNGVTSQHLNGETEVLSLKNGVCRIVSGRVEHGKHANNLPWVVATLGCNTKGSETTSGKVSCGITVVLSGGLVAFSNGEHGLGRTLAESPFLALERANGGDSLGDGVEGHVLLGLPALLQDFSGLWVSLEGQDSDLVDRVESLQVVGRS